METVSEYIERNTILKVLADSEPKEEDWRTDNIEGYDLRKIRYLAASNVYEEIKDILSCKRLIADVAPVVHGHWSKELRFTEDFMGNRTYGYKCSVCGKLANRLPFCGNCGAKMDESEE